MRLFAATAAATVVAVVAIAGGLVANRADEETELVPGTSTP